MNALFLRDLAAKTHRGMRGRVEAGMSGGGLTYGYRVVRRLNADGTLVTGEREIDAAEAAVVTRIFQQYAAGVPPKKIALALNAEGISAPRGGGWTGSTINGNLAALADLSGAWIDRVHARRPQTTIVLDMDSSVSETHGMQEGSAYNGHYACTCYHPLFVFN